MIRRTQHHQAEVALAKKARRASELSRSAAGLVYDLAIHGLQVRAIVFVVIGISLGLRAAPQAQDALVTLGQDGTAGSWTLFGASVFWLALNAWFWAGFALSHRRAGADEAAISRARRHRRAQIRLWLPRALGCVPFIGVGWALIGAAAAVPAGMHAMMGDRSGSDSLTTAGLVIILAGLAVFASAARSRHPLLRRWRQILLRRPRPSPSAATAVQPSALIWDFGPAGLALAVASALVALAGMVFYGAAPVRAGNMLQAGPTILLAAAGLICGGAIVTRYGAQTGLPILATLVGATIALADLRDAGIIADNHDMRVIRSPSRPRATVEAAFRAFLADARPHVEPGQPVPVILVATSGGGLAAAYWTATVLGDLAENVPEFSNRLFAVSGVSGGALGALETVAALEKPPAGAACAGIQACAQAALAADFLAPALGSLLYPDLAQRLIPFPLFSDRATALERAWEVRWREVTHTNVLAGPFLDIWPARHPWPALLLNGTSAISGGRLITTNLRLRNDINAAGDVGPGTDLLENIDAEIPASTAADNSARFPYFSPLGVVRPKPAMRTGPDLIGDGGYFEDFGATTLLELLDRLRAISAHDAAPVRFIVIQIVGVPARTAARPDQSIIPRGLSGPLTTLLNTRSARGTAATQALARRATALGGVYLEARLGISPTGETAPLSWSLSSVARHVIAAQWTPAWRARVEHAMK